MRKPSSVSANSRFLVVGKVRQVDLNFSGRRRGSLLYKDGNAVIGSLAGEHAFITRRLQSADWKILVGKFGLLQTDEVARMQREPLGQVRQPYLERIDVPRGNAESHRLCGSV